MKEWQFNVLFFVGVGGAILLLIGPEVGLEVGRNPTAVSGVGAILAYILTQKKALTKSNDEKRIETTKTPDRPDKKEGEDGIE